MTKSELGSFRIPRGRYRTGCAPVGRFAKADKQSWYCGGSSWEYHCEQRTKFGEMGSGNAPSCGGKVTLVFTCGGRDNLDMDILGSVLCKLTTNKTVLVERNHH